MSRYTRIRELGFESGLGWDRFEKLRKLLT